MLKSEFEALVGSSVTSAQWEVIDRVYTFHPDIHDVGGKEQIASIWKSGCEGNGYYLIAGMLTDANKAAMQEGCPEVVDRREDEFTTYEVRDHIVRNEKGKPLKEVCEHFVGKLKSDHKELWEKLEYFTGYWKDPGEMTHWPVDFRHMACFAEPGSSEGYYVHVEAITREGTRSLLFVGKCWSMDDALAISNVLTRLIYGN
ncbi:MAG TPA: hypothetical protein PLG17_09525 [Thermodesulfobacteriota bacterium]|jgi:hypothetical protein|nr:hypothetical protein [Methanoregulaceae archaeon]HQO78738.1 hypothetical protein [Thermodesulfobacteriota bacterium]